MLLQNCNNNTFTSNIIRDNGGRGIVSAQNCDMNHFIGNFFMGNDIHAIQDPSNINYWNGSVVGNFWDNYNGKDADSDGIGDTPHYFAGGNDSLPIWENLGPNISINLPADNATFGNTAPDFEVKIKDETVLLLKDIVHVDTMWYTLDGGNINHTFTINQTIDQAAWDALSEGLIILKFYSNDTLGNIGVAEVLIYKEDTTPPIWNPVPTNQIVELGDSFSYDLDATDPSGIQGWGLNDTTYFSVDSDGLITNTSVLEVGIYWLEVWVNDTHDNQRSASLKITVVDTTPPTDGAIPGYNSFFIIVSLLTFFAVTHKYQIKKKKD